MGKKSAYKELIKKVEELEKKRFRTIIEDVSGIAIRGYDETHRVIFWNPASEDVYGYSEQEAFGKTLEELIIPEEMRDDVSANIDKWIQFGEKIPAGETELLHKDGHRVPVYSSHVMHETSGKKEFFCIDIDLTLFKLAEAENIEAQKIISEQQKLSLVGQIAGKMAHDFNNILSVIMGNAELALLDCKDIGAKKALEIIFDQTIRGRNLTKKLVAFAKDQEPRQEYFSVSSKIDFVLNLLEKDLRGISVIREEDSKLPEILGDPGMVEYSIVNLIQNAIHAMSMSDTPEIIIRTYCCNGSICFDISDNGCGIPTEFVEKIFEPSFTLKGSRDLTGSYKAGIKGTGYGISNVKKYVKQHRGTISVASKQNVGTKFKITIPLLKKELTQQEKLALAKGRLVCRKRILVVEDEQAISDIQCRVLSHDPFHHQVDLARDGKSAIEMFTKNRYDLISLDYILPGTFNGKDIYDAIRKTDNIIPIIFISGNIEFLESLKELYKKDNYLAHLSKPCHNRYYANRINSLLAKSECPEG